MKHLTTIDIENNYTAFKLAANDILNRTATTVRNGIEYLIKDQHNNLYTPEALLYYYINELYHIGFDATKAILFTKLIEELCPFKQISSILYSWFDKTIIEPYFKRVDTYNYILKGEVIVNIKNKREVLHFCCFIALLSIKNDAYYRKRAAFAMLDAIEQLGSMEVEYLRLHGSNDFPESDKLILTPDYEFKANDVFCTIDMKVLNESAQSYTALLKAINKLLDSGKFPESFNVTFKSDRCSPIPIKGLPIDAMHQFIGNALQYKSTHSYIEEFAKLALSRNEWYIDFDGVSTIPTGMYATLALAYLDKVYFYLLQQFLIDVDSEHSLYHHHIFNPFILKYGITAETLPLIIGFVESDADYVASKEVIEVAHDENSIALLKEFTKNPTKYIPIQIYNDYCGNKPMWSKEKCENFFIEKVICALYGTLHRDDSRVPTMLR